jgi:hypothetical protein
MRLWHRTSHLRNAVGRRRLGFVPGAIKAAHGASRRVSAFSSASPHPNWTSLLRVATAD